MTKLNVTVFHVDGRTSDKTIQVSRIANLGMSSREPPEDVVKNRQVASMDEAGVPEPEELPFIVPKPNNLITTNSSIQVNSGNTAGELEFVLLPTDECTYVGVGNDHKDRDIDSTAMHKANSTCPSVVSDELWMLEEIRDHWDSLQLRSWIEVDGALESHQESSLDAFLPPETILERVEQRITEPLVGTAIWSGTVGTGDEGVDPFPSVVPSPHHVLQLYDPVLERRLCTHYEVRLNDWISGIKLE